MALKKIPSRADRNLQQNHAFYAARPELVQKMSGRHLPKKYLVLKYMVVGEGTEPWVYGGKGTALINCLGGFAYDSDVRKMIEDGLVTSGRIASRKSAHGGTNDISYTQLTITDKGRAEYARLKKRLDK